MRKEAKGRSFIWFGAICGFIFAAWVFQIPRPAFCVFLQVPLALLFKFIEGSRSVPRGSLGGLIFIPLWFVYWAGLGALIGFLLHWIFHFYKSRRKENEVVTEDKANEQPAMKGPSRMRFVYIVGFLVLAMFFAIIKQKLHGWKPVGFVLLWLFIIGAVSFPLLKLIRRFPPTKPYSSWGAIHAALETMPAALLFSPTFVYFYMFGFPAPATLALLGFLFADRKQTQGLVRINVLMAIGGIICFWFIIWAGKFICQARRLQKEANDETGGTGSMLCVIAIGAIIFGIVAYFLHRLLFGLQTYGP